MDTQNINAHGFPARVEAVKRMLPESLRGKFDIAVESAVEAFELPEGLALSDAEIALAEVAAARGITVGAYAAMLTVGGEV